MKEYIGKVVHCPTKEEAEIFLSYADKNGWRWRTGSSLISMDMWEPLREQMAYLVHEEGVMTYGSVLYYGTERYEVVKFNDVNIDRETIDLYSLEGVVGG